MEYTTFHNLTVSIRAKTPKEAYTKLCNALDKVEGDWWSDTYSVNDNGDQRETTELFPEG